MALYNLAKSGVTIRNGIVVNMPPPGSANSANNIKDRGQEMTLAGLNSTQLAKTLDARYRNGDWYDEFPIAAASGDVASSVGSGNAVVTYGAAGENRRHSIEGVAWSYDTTPTNGSLSIEAGAGNYVFGPLAITSAGPGFLPFDPPKMGGVDEALIVTLRGGAGSVSGQLSVLGHRVL
ncbi:MAG: hypothetical protein K2R98_19530 [Gemmataceae bacterium]|nr:hypothetical protein [Gemmataceae bacterium]